MATRPEHGAVTAEPDSAPCSKRSAPVVRRTTYGTWVPSLAELPHSVSVGTWAMDWWQKVAFSTSLLCLVSDVFCHTSESFIVTARKHQVAA